MGFGNVLIAVFLTYYSMYIISLVSADKRKNISNLNLDLDKLRKEQVKTLEEQKKFVDLKYPKTIGKSKFSYKSIPFILWRIFYFGVLIYAYIMLLSPFDIGLWVAIPVVMILPIVINLVLAKFNLQKSDLRVFLR